jgi:hypothetical protein
LYFIDKLAMHGHVNAKKYTYFKVFIKKIFQTHISLKRLYYDTCFTAKWQLGFQNLSLQQLYQPLIHKQSKINVRQFVIPVTS